MPETYMQVHMFCGLVGHYRRFIKGFTNIALPLYDMLGKEVKMGPVDLPPEVREAVDILKRKVQSVPVLVFQFRQTFSARNRCLQGRTGSHALPEARGWTPPSSRIWQLLTDLIRKELS